MTVTQFYGWFKHPIQRWIQIAKCKAMSRIKKAVELDKVDETNIVSIDSDATFPNRVRVQKIRVKLFGILFFQIDDFATVVNTFFLVGYALFIGDVKNNEASKAITF